jgi:hypothetical protein
MKKLLLLGLLLSNLCFAAGDKGECPFNFSVMVAGSDQTMMPYKLDDKVFEFTTPGDFKCTASETVVQDQGPLTLYAKAITCTKNDVSFTNGVACIDGTGRPFMAQNLFIIMDKDKNGAIVIARCQPKQQ